MMAPVRRLHETFAPRVVEICARCDVQDNVVTLCQTSRCQEPGRQDEPISNHHDSVVLTYQRIPHERMEQMHDAWPQSKAENTQVAVTPLRTPRGEKITQVRQVTSFEQA